jgi:hypothetical protein
MKEAMKTIDQTRASGGTHREPLLALGSAAIGYATRSRRSVRPAEDLHVISTGEMLAKVNKNGDRIRDELAGKIPEVAKLMEPLP